MMEIKVGGEGRGKNEGFDFFALNFEFNYLSFLHIFLKNSLTTTYVDLTSSFWLWVQRMDCWILTLRLELHGNNFFCTKDAFYLFKDRK